MTHSSRTGLTCGATFYTQGYAEYSKQIAIISFLGISFLLNHWFLHPIDCLDQTVQVYKCKQSRDSDIIKITLRETNWLSFFPHSATDVKRYIEKNTILSCGVRAFMSVGNQTQSTANSAHWVCRQTLPTPQMLAEMRLQVITTLGEIFSLSVAFLFTLAPSLGSWTPQDQPHLISWLQDWQASLLDMMLNIKNTSTHHPWLWAENRTFTGNWIIGLLYLVQLNIPQTHPLLGRFITIHLRFNVRQWLCEFSQAFYGHSR